MKSMDSRPLFLGLALSLSLTVAPASATSLAIDSGSLTFVRSIVAGVETDDIRGLANFAVSNPELLGFVTLTDSGTDPGYATLPFGNDVLVGLNAGPTEVALFFTFFDTLIANGAPAVEPLYLVGVLPNPLTDPALRGLTSTGKILLGFKFAGDLSTTPLDRLLVYTLASAEIAAVPEPSTFMIGGLGLVALLLIRGGVRRSSFTLRRLHIGASALTVSGASSAPRNTVTSC